ncbi:MAG: porin [Xanthobacteraceae bacterium]
MNIAKSLILGSAATLVALGGAQAADLPLKAKAVEYVKVCSLYGAGFYYIPGTDTCLKLGGYIRADVTFNGGAGYNGPAWSGNAGQQNRLRDNYIARSRLGLDIDTRTATEYGVVRTYFNGVVNWTTGDAIAGGALGVYYAFIQFAGFTMGKAVSQFSTPWTGYPGNNTSYLLGGEDDVTGINQIAYTAQFGNGVSASVSLEEPSAYRNGGLYNVDSGPSGAFANVGGVATSVDAVTLAAQQYFQGVPGLNSYAGTNIPDIVGQIRVDQAWGLFQLSAAAHQIRASYYGTSPSLNETLGHPADTWGYAVQVGLSLKNLPTGAGDSINFSAGYANGASRYVLGGVSPNNFAMFGNTSNPLAYQSVAIAASGDGVFGNGTGIEKSSVWGVRGAFNHNWDPYWSSSLFGSYTAVDWGAGGTALICTGRGLGNIVAVSQTSVCNPNFSIAQVGTTLRWTPVKNLTLSGEVMYTYLDQRNEGVVAAAGAGPVNNNLVGSTKPAGAAYEFKDQGTWTFNLRAHRTF